MEAERVVEVQVVVAGKVEVGVEAERVVEVQVVVAGKVEVGVEAERVVEVQVVVCVSTIVCRPRAVSEYAA